MNISLKTLLNNKIQEQTSYFILSDRNTLIYRQASSVPMTVFRDEATLLQKTEERLSSTALLGFIYESDLPDEAESDQDKLEKAEDELKEVKLPKSANSFYWKTTQDKVQQALDYGITRFEALTSKVIGAVGAYRLKVFERAYDYGIISDKYEQKEFLLRITQTRIRHLQALERLINTYENSSNEAEAIQRIEETFDDYIQQLAQLQANISDNFMSLYQYDLDANEKILEQIQGDIEAAREYKASFNYLPKVIYGPDAIKNTVLAASGPDSIAHFIKLRMICALRQAQEHNQNMTYSRNAGSLFRGEFNSYCEDALKEINNHLCDHHNPITPQHQGYFSTNPDHSVTLDFRHLGKNRRTVRQYIMAITQIEGADKINKNPNDEYILVSCTLEKPEHKVLKITRFTSWDIQANWDYAIKRLLYWTWNMGMGIVIGIIDLPYGLISGIRGLEPTSNVSKYCLEFIPECAKATRFHELADNIDFPAVSLGARLGGLIGNLIRNTLWELVKGVRTTLQRARFQVGENLATDYEIGHHGLPAEAEIVEQVAKELGDLQLEETKGLQKLNKKHKRRYNAPLFSSGTSNSKKDLGEIKAEEIQGQFAKAPYELDPGEWNELLNSALGAVKYLFDFVIDDIHVKHPFSGLCYNVAYVLGAWVVFSPKSFESLPNSYLQISKALADAASSNLSAGASFSASVQAQLAAMTPELLVSGRNSWLISGLTSLEEDPSDIVAYCAIAVGFGALLAYVLNIPFISAGIRSELGTFPAIALGMAGAKFGIVMLELFQAESSEANKDTSAVRERLKLVLIEHYQKKYALTDSQMNEIINTLVNPAFIKELQAKANEVKERSKLLMLLQQHQHLLPYLPYRSKRFLMELMHQKEGEYPGGASAMHLLLFPEPKRSIMDITVSTILDYIPAIGGCLTSVVTWDIEPWRYLSNKILKDVGRIFHAISNKIIKAMMHYLRVNLRIIFDIVFNEIFSRIEGFIFNDSHQLSASNYSASTDVDTSYETAKEFFAQPVDSLRHAVTHTHPQSFLPRALFQAQFEQSTDAINTKVESEGELRTENTSGQETAAWKRPKKDNDLFETNKYPAVRFFRPVLSSKRNEVEIEHRGDLSVKRPVFTTAHDFN